MERRLVPLMAALVSSLVLFGILFLVQGNTEFVFYLILVTGLSLAVFVSMRHVAWPTSVLWGLLAWAILHMAGGGIPVGNGVLYSHVLLPLVGEPYSILKYDQVVHVFGFFMATLVAWTLLKPSLKDMDRTVAVGIVIVMAGLGLGALNEIIEFLITVITPENNVGGYENTALDLVADLIGAVLAWVYITSRRAVSHP